MARRCGSPNVLTTGPWYPEYNTFSRQRIVDFTPGIIEACIKSNDIKTDEIPVYPFRIEKFDKNSGRWVICPWFHRRRRSIHLGTFNPSRICGLEWMLQFSASNLPLSSVSRFGAVGLISAASAVQQAAVSHC